MSYRLKIPDVETCYDKYVLNASYYDKKDLDITSMVLKIDLKKRLDVFKTFGGQIFISILEDDVEDYKADLVFDFAKRDIYIKIDYIDVDSWSANIMYGEECLNQVNKGFDKKVFVENIEKPCKFLFVHLYERIVQYLDKNIKELLATKQLTDAIVKKVIENQGAKKDERQNHENPEPKQRKSGKRNRKTDSKATDVETAS